MGLFIHYDISVFQPGFDFRANRDAGVPPVDIFNPSQLDTDQWLQAATSIGAKYAVLTAKHCTGFCLWPTEAYPYSVRQSPWRGGQGDIVGDFVRSCRKVGVKPALYCSFPANWYLRVDDPGRVLSGNEDEQRRYVKIYETLVTELWSRYGEMLEIWFDGSATPVSEGGPDLMPILHKYQPIALCFGGPNPSIRWIGNEDGWAHYPTWSAVSAADRVPNHYGHKYSGNPDEGFWCPAEADTTLIHRDAPTAGWMWSPGCEDRIYSTEHLIGLYYTSVGRNCNFLLNASPSPDGLLPERHMQRYAELGQEIRRRFGSPVAKTSGSGDMIELELPTKFTIVNHAILREEIRLGHRVREYVIEAQTRWGWRELCSGTSDRE